MVNAKELKKKEIIRIAAKEFAEKGFESTNINEIAILAGIGKGSIYLYFKTKKELYLSTMRAVVEQFNMASDAIMNLDYPLLDKLRLCLQALFSFEEKDVPFLILWSRYQFQNSPDFQDEVIDIFKDLRQPICEIIADGARERIFNTPYPETSGYLILAMVGMLIPNIQSKPLLENVSVEEKIEYIINLIQNGLQCNK